MLELKRGTIISVSYEDRNTICYQHLIIALSDGEEVEGTFSIPLNSTDGKLFAEGDRVSCLLKNKFIVQIRIDRCAL